MVLRSRPCLIVVALLIACGSNAAGNGDPTIPPPTGGNNDTASGDADPELDCGPQYDDDLRLSYADEVEAPDEVLSIAAVDGTAVVGGDDFVAVLDGDGFGDALDVDGNVTALAAVGDSHVAIGTSGGDVIIAEIDGDGLTQTGSVAVGARVRGLASDGSAIWAAASGEGVQALSFDGGDVTADGAFGNVAFARGIAYTDDTVVVAAGADGVVILDTAGGEVSTVATDSPVDDIVADDGAAIALRSAQGWDLVSLGSNAKIEASVPTAGISLDATFVDGGVLIVEGHAVTRYALDGGAPEQLSVENRRDLGTLDGTWVIGIAPLDDDYVVIDNAAAIPLTVRDEEDLPQISVDVPNLAIWADAGDETEAAYLVRNTGTEELLIGSVEADGDFKAALQTDTLEEDNDCDGYYAVPPGGTVLIDIEYDAGDDHSEDTLTILSNDPDEPRLEIPLDGNRDGIEEDDTVIDFTALTLDGELFRLSDHEGKVIFLKLFNFGCATCAEEFPEIQDSLIPSYDEDDFIAVGVNTTHRTSYADELAAMAGLSMPVVLDIDSEAFRHYRIPRKVFPLHIVIGRDGKVQHINNEAGIELVEAAIAAAM